MATTVVIADDSILLREGTARLLAEHDFDVVGQASDAEELLLKVRSYKPDIAIVDIRMPPSHTDEGLRAAKEIRTAHPSVSVLVLSQHVETEYAMELLAESAEGVGYLLKDRVADIDEFVAAVQRVADGGSALDSAIVSRLRRAQQAPTTRSTRSARASAKSCSSWPKGSSNGAIASSHVRHRARRREARDEHLRKARARR